MGLIGMTEAGRRLGVTSNSARRALQNADVPLTIISARSYAVDETDLQAFIDKRVGYKFGRPRKDVTEPQKAEE